MKHWFGGNPKNPVFKLLLPLMGGTIRNRANKNNAKLKEILESEA